MSNMHVYPVTLVFRTEETVREPQLVWDWNAEPPRQVANGYHVYRVPGQRQTTREVVAESPTAAWKTLAEMKELKGVPLTGSDLISVQVGAPLPVDMVAWMKRQRANPVVW